MQHLAAVLTIAVCAACSLSSASAEVPLKDLEVTLEVLEDDGSGIDDTIANLPSPDIRESMGDASGTLESSDDGFVDDAGSAASDELEGGAAEVEIDDGFESNPEYSDDIPLGIGDDLDEEEEVELDTFDEEVGSGL